MMTLYHIHRDDGTYSFSTQIAKKAERYSRRGRKVTAVSE